jgi:hypothetical protein
MIRQLRATHPDLIGIIRKRLAPMLLGGCFLASIIPLQPYLWPQPTAQAATHLALVQPGEEALQGITFTLHSNDSVSDFGINGYHFSGAELDSMWEPTYAVEIRSHNHFACIHVLFDSLLYTQRWDTLPQLRFWQRIMTMSKDSCLVSLASDRTVIDKMPIWAWEAMKEAGQARYRDSMLQALGLPAHEHIYVTAGKNHYYQFERVLPTIGTAIEVFRQEEVDPWYAQAILLIESPGALHRSPVGAYGSFQLMAEVGREQGLIVNDSIDEREDFIKAAGAAARHLAHRCVRPVRNYLRNYDLEFRETDLWFRMLVLHAYHAGPGNVASVLEKIQPTEGGIPLMQKVWTTEAAGFKNASQNYSQLALASMLQVDQIMRHLPDSICHEAPEVYALADSAESAAVVAAP